MEEYEGFKRREMRKDGMFDFDVFEFEKIPPLLRIQIWGMLERLWATNFVEEVEYWSALFSSLREDYLEVSTFQTGYPKSSLRALVEGTNDLHLLITVMETAIEMRISVAHHNPYKGRKDAITTCIPLFRRRLAEHGLGYEYRLDDLRIYRRDDDILHQEAVLPALAFLRDPQFKEANDEYRLAHRHYLDENIKESMNAAVRAFETTMKTICRLEDITYREEKDSAKDLIDKMFEAGFFDTFLADKLANLRKVIEGVTTFRNKKSGHGQEPKIHAPTIEELPEYYAQYVLTTVGSVITLLVNTYRDRTG